MVEKYPTEVKICCPKCNGRGYLVIKSSDYTKRGYKSPRTRKSILLRNKMRKFGKEKTNKFSLRELGRKFGVNGPESIKFHLDKIEQSGWNNYENIN